MAERERITVYRDELEFILRELEEFRDKLDTFTRERFSVDASVMRVRGMLGIVSDPDKTPVRPPFSSYRATKSGGHKIGE